MKGIDTIRSLVDVAAGLHNLRDGSVQLEIEKVRLNAGQEWSSQSDQWRFILLQVGTAYWLDGSKARELNPGELLIVSPGRNGVIRASQLSEVALHWFGFRTEGLLGFLYFVERQWIENNTAATIGPVSCLPATHPVSREMWALGDLAGEASGPVQRARALVLAVRLLTESMPARDTEPKRGGAAMERFQEIIGRMTDSELIRHSSKELARLCGCTPRHFNRLFRSRFGAPTRVRQTELRLLKACQLLQTSATPIAQVAADCGYHSLNLFNSLFRRRFGMSPSEWRNRTPSQRLTDQR